MQLKKKNKLQMDLMSRLKAHEVLRSETTVYLQVLKGNVPVEDINIQDKRKHLV